MLQPGSNKPILIWCRRDFRLDDHPALVAAAARSVPIIPVVILDPLTQRLGAAPAWRLEQAIATFDQALRERGARLVLRRGDPLIVLSELAHETGATAVYWSRQYSADTVARDTAVKTGLEARGLEAKSFPGWLLFEPWSVEKQTGGSYTVYTPFWRNVAQRNVADPLPPPKQLQAPGRWPKSEALSAWCLGGAMQRGGPVVAEHVVAGEQAAQDRLAAFLAGQIDDYQIQRDMPAINGTARMSGFLALGEISPRRIWHAAHAALDRGSAGAETFLKQLVWREFAWHLLWHRPDIVSRNWRDGWDRFPWRADNEDAEAWRRGATGEPMVDAGMRELYVTGQMHNRVRMLTASYLTKHLLTDWRVGQAWFEDCLIDWDPASNAMGWQWVAGSGPDASPYFRIFNPATQAQKFDPQGQYRAHYLQGDGAAQFFEAIPQSWQLSGQRPDTPIIALDAGRKRALAAYAALKG